MKYKIRMVIEYSSDLPDSIDSIDSADFYLNESSRCASLVIDGLDYLADKNPYGCICDKVYFEVLGIDNDNN
jgi:hypothetical protein